MSTSRERHRLPLLGRFLLYKLLNFAVFCYLVNKFQAESNGEGVATSSTERRSVPRQAASWQCVMAKASNDLDSSSGGQWPNERAGSPGAGIAVSSGLTRPTPHRRESSPGKHRRDVFGCDTSHYLANLWAARASISPKLLRHSRISPRQATRMMRQRNYFGPERNS